jgi:predicted HAD superfamily phosphohydrolase YqeG
MPNTMTAENSIYIDVDNTLIIDGKPNEPLINWLRDYKEEYVFVLWSLAGQEHAKDIADQFDITNLFRYILSKPKRIIDDRCWEWTRETSCYRPKSTKFDQ